MQNLTEIGRIVLLQVQPTKIKEGTYPDEDYLPGRLLPVAQLVIDPRGVHAVDAGGKRVVDVHHRDHPNSRFRGENGLSVGFTSHYHKMQDHFGEHLTFGCAGENIIVEAEQTVALSDVQPQLWIHNRAADRWLALDEVAVAAPCLPFARFASGQPLDAQETKAALQFLHHGLRGFYAKPTDLVQAACIAVGDVLYVTKGDGREDVSGENVQSS